MSNIGFSNYADLLINSNMDFKDFKLLTLNRRSIFPSVYSGEVIDDSVVTEILDIARWAPNHKMTEPWRFKVYSGKSKMILSDFLGHYYKENTPIEKFSETKYKRTMDKPLKSSHIIALCMQKDPQERVPEWEEIAAVSCAVMSMWLACTSLGLGSYWSSPKSVTSGPEFLKLDAGERCLGLFYIGVPKVVPETKVTRRPLSEVVEWI